MKKRRRRRMRRGRRWFNYLLSTEDLYKLQRHACAQGEGIELDATHRWKPKVEQPTYIKQSRLQSKNSNKRQGHDRMLKGLMHEDIIITNIYVLNFREPRNVKGEMGHNIVIVGNFSLIIQMEINKVQITQIKIKLNHMLEQINRMYWTF